MQYRVFSAPVGDPSGCDELNRFLAGHRVLSVQGSLLKAGATCQPPGMARTMLSQPLPAEGALYR